MIKNVLSVLGGVLAVITVLIISFLFIGVGAKALMLLDERISHQITGGDANARLHN